jgi:hypothetical protein
VPELTLLLIPLAVLALVAIFGFVGCTKDYDALVVEPEAPKPYAEEVLDSVPIAYWRLSDPDGSTEAKDEIGAAPVGHPGVYHGDVQLGQLASLNLSHPAATAAGFDGESYVEVAHAQEFETDEFTVEALVRPMSVVSSGVIVGTMPSQPGGPTPSSGGWALTIALPGDVPDIEGHFVAMVDSATGPVGPNPVAFDLAKLGTAWHLAMTYNGDELALYWEGAKQEWASFPYDPNPQEPLRIGVGVKGAIQEVALYDRALPPDEISLHFSANTAPDSS